MRNSRRDHDRFKLEKPAFSHRTGSFRSVLLLLVMTGCQALPPAPVVTAQRAAYRAIGTEPFWDLKIDDAMMVFTDRGNGVGVSEPAPRVTSGAGGERFRGRRLVVGVVHAPCSDGMSDRVYPDTVTVGVDRHAYRGCGAAAAWFAAAREQEGTARAAAPRDTLVGRWMVATIDGRAVRAGERFQLVVTPTAVSTEGLCNDLRGRYALDGGRLVPDGPPWPRSERGCAAERMALEDRVYAVMVDQPLVSFPARGRLRLTSARASIELVRGP